MDALLAEDFSRVFCQFIGVQCTRGACLGAHNLTKHRLQFGEHPNVVFVGEHPDHADEPVEGEVPLQGAPECAGTVGVVRGVDKHGGCGADTFEPAWGFHGGESFTDGVDVQRPAGSRAEECFHSGQSDGRVVGLVLPRERQENVGVVPTKSPQGELLPAHGDGG